ncbi:MAG TPA: enoyl-CoA hydratase/isomerase family protein [Dehalococcoidia bacterium]|nr:enoyl-CoA hydratase/isomerase family protein [Dehalococcoidia bacterium]
MTETAEVLCERRGPVAILTLSHPSALNAMTWTMYEALHAYCGELDADESVRVVVVQGAGDRAFVAGTDITQFRQFATGEDGVKYEENLDRYVGSLENLGKPTIAKIRGYAVGGGASLALACDLRIATPALKFGVPIARTLGNCLSSRTLARIVELVGPSRAKQIIYTAELLEGTACLAFGIVNEVVEDGDLDLRVEALAAQISGYAPLTLAATKRTITHILEERRPQADVETVRRVYESHDFHEGVAAFVEKRRPLWSGK